MTNSQRPTHPVEVDAARSGDGDISLNTLNLRWENREILYFQGVDFNNQDFERRSRKDHTLQNISIPGIIAASENIPRLGPPWTMMRRLALVPNASRDVWEYRSDEQRVMYTLRLSNSREEFRNALETPGALVYYAGHARYGQGPTFGAPNELSGELWGGDSDNAAKGSLRMGFPYLARDVNDIFHHGYTPQLVSASTTLDPIDCDPENLRPTLARFRPMRLHEIDPRLPALLPHLQPDALFFARRKHGHSHTLNDQRKRTLVVLQAGWKHTRGESLRMDLDSIRPRCRAFVCMACASYWHFFTPWRAFKRWQSRGDDQLFYSASKTIFEFAFNFYLYHLLTYPERSGWRPWKPWMDWAMHRTNRWFAAYDQKHLGVRITNGLTERFSLPDGECHCGPRR